MLQITDRAARQLKAVLSEADCADNACFRLGVKDNRLQIVIDQERPGDTPIGFEGETLAVVDPKAASRFFNRKLDFKEQSSSLVLVEAE